MKKLLLLVTLHLLAVTVLFAQSRVSGTVTDSETGEALPGVAVLIKGTTMGAYTDDMGKYNVDVPADATTLVFTFVGKKTTEELINGRTTINVGLVADDVLLDEVVVTALGIKRDERSLGYSVQEIKGEDASLVRDQNVVAALTGKIAGVQVVSASGASLGGSSKIRIRGANSLTGGDPLFVVDGTPIANDNFSGQDNGFDRGNFAQDINPDDIESISVLKGPSATALYGNRAANGVILITTKKGASRPGIGVDINSSVTFERVYIMPDYQDEYAGGYTLDFIPVVDPVDGQTYNTLNYAADESWGPRIDGTQYRPWWSWYPGPDYGKTIPLSSNPDNVRDFFETGVTYNNSVALSGGSDKTTWRLSYTNISQTGVIPNTELNRNNVGVNLGSKLTEKLKFDVSLNIAVNDGFNRPTFGYVGATNPVMSFNQWWQRQLDIDRLRDYKNEDGTFRSWNIRSATNLRPLYWDSPFFSVFENTNDDSRNRYFGNIALSYELAEGLTLKGIVRRDDYTQRYSNRIASGGLDQDDYTESVITAREDNYEVLLTYDNTFGAFTLNANAGGNIRKNDYHSNSMSTVGGLNSPNLYNIKASTDRPAVSSFISERQVNSVYGALSLGYNDILYLDATLRNDWSSTLPTDNNSYLYPSIGGSFIFSELLGASNVVSYGKLRASFAQVGADIGPYQTNFTYGAGTPYGSLPTFSLPNTLINENLVPALSSSYEFGLDMKFFQNRVGFDLTFYKNEATDQILNLTVPGSSGFSSAIINAGKITSQGVELALYATPVSTKNFSWDLNLNFARNTSEVEELADGLDNVRLDAWGWGGLSVNAPVGEEWGLFRGRGYRYFQATDAEGNPIDHPSNGQKVITEDGRYLTENNKDLGGLLPDFTGGLMNTFSIYGFDVSAFIEFQQGGQFHSVTRMFNAYSGLGPETVGNNDKGNPIRNPVDQGGGVKVDGVLADGTPFSTYRDAQTLYSNDLFANNEHWMYDASYVKLREVRVGYNFPQSLYRGTPIQRLNLSLIARNLWLIHSNVDGIDPSEIPPGSSQYVFQENGILPGVRSIGVNLKVGF